MINDFYQMINRYYDYSEWMINRYYSMMNG
jgi:hypothetical protein